MTTLPPQEIAVARQEISYYAVAAAAETLQNDNKEVTLEAVSAALGNHSLPAVHKHLAEWRASQAKPAEAPKPEIPEAILSQLSSWVQQYAEQAGAGSREALAQTESDMEALLKAGEALEGERDGLSEQLASVTAERDDAIALATERAEQIERLTAELRNAKLIATEALVSKAKDQLAIDGKDQQLAELRAQLERNVAAHAAESDARLAAEMELVGAVTARDSFEAEIKELRAQLESTYNDRRKAAGVK